MVVIMQLMSPTVHLIHRRLGGRLLGATPPSLQWGVSTLARLLVVLAVVLVTAAVT